MSKFGLCFAFISARWHQNNFLTPGLSNILQNTQFTWMFCANWLNIFWVSKENIAIGQMDLSCPWTVQNETLQKCRETIPLVQVCFRFELSFTVSKLLSKIWVWNHEILTIFWLFLPFFSTRWRQKNCKTTGLFKLHQNTQFLKIWWESVE